MSYVYLILAKGGDPNEGLRLMDIPAEWRDGTFVATGELQDRPAPAEDLWDMLDDGEESDCPMAPVDLPDGWECLARFWCPARYVPESREVRNQARQDAIQKLKDMGLWREPNG